jgi:diaminohydroxyphosphoribosylaminopyrimidine deaminase/5-amino-6-(5-phosphoribosylamino)uracil reductase
MTNILVEGGAEILGSFLDACAIDEVHVFVAPRLLGGSAGRTPIGGLGAATIASALPVVETSVEVIEGDVLVHGRLVIGDW